MRFISLIFALLLFGSPANAALSIDGTATAAAHQTSPSISTSAIATVNAGDIIVVVAHAEWVNAVGAHGTISGISDTSGLSWQKRNSASLDNAGFGSAYNDFEVWWAYSSGTLAADVITVTWTQPGGNNPDDVTVLAFGVTGFTGTSYHTNPWDTATWNPAFGANSATSSDPTVTSVSTSNAATMVIGAGGSAGSSTFPVADTGSGWTSIASAGTGSGTNNSAAGAQFQNFASTQSSLTVPFATSINGWAMTADALSVTGGPIPSGSAPTRTLLGVGQ